jgi:hypothetical protein
MPNTQLPAVVTILDLATTATVPATAVLEVQFNTGAVSTTVGVSLTQLATSFGPLSLGLQRAIASAGNLPIATTDVILNFNLGAVLTATVPLATSRNGVPLVFVDASMNFSTNTLTLNRTGSDTFSSLTTIVMNVNGQSLRLVPFNDGVNTGYWIG